MQQLKKTQVDKDRLQEKMQKMLESNKYNAGCMEINHPAKGNALKVNPLLSVTKDWTDSVKERYEQRVL